MALKKLTLFLLLFIGYSYSSNAQLFPVGTKLHVAHLTSYSETKHQSYVKSSLDTLSQNGHLYTIYDSYIRLDSNKLYELNWNGNSDYLLFDFNAKLNDTLTIHQHYYKLSPPENRAPVTIKIDSINYDYYFNERNERDSLKTLWYSGILRVPYNPLDNDTLPHSFRSRMTEKVIRMQTSTLNTFLGVNIGARTASDDHNSLRCIEFPDGKMIKMEWWYKMAGNTYPCDYTFTLGNTELQAKSGIEVYPNPASNQLFVKNYSGIINVFNRLGQQVISTQTAADLPIDISECKNGLYYIEIANNQRFPLAIIH